MTETGSIIMKSCACGGLLKGRGTDVALGTTRVKCEKCGLEYDYTWGKNDMKEVRWDSNFFILRKQWARNLLNEAKLGNPGDTTSGVFEGMTYSVSVGPRRGVRIHECN